MTEPQALTQMLNELESHMLVTILAPSRRRENEHDQIRVNADINPRWYSRLCAEYPSKRQVRKGKFDTKIKRANILSILRRLLARGPQRSKYDGHLRSIARERAKVA